MTNLTANKLPNPLELTVIILTYNEEIHIERCLQSLRGIARRIVVVDSNSHDGTRDRALRAGAEVYTNRWVSYSSQFNWALDNVGINTEWVMRLDADEILLPDLVQQLRAILPHTSKSIHGYTINLRRYFLNKFLKHGALYPIRMLRIWRSGSGRCESRWMDEHIVVQGDVAHINADFADHNLNNIGWWTAKHNHYATREAIDSLLGERTRDRVISDLRMSTQARIKRWMKRNVYARLPLCARSLFYFLYRFVFRLGFLDGWPGMVFHVLQGFWYRFLVDVKIRELRQLMLDRGHTLAQVVKTEYGIDVEQLASDTNASLIRCDSPTRQENG